MNKIFISIASYRDKELIPTIKSIINNADNPKNLFLSIVSQDEDDMHIDDSEFKSILGGIFLYKINHAASKGVGWARSIAQKELNSSYDYYLQIDSHMRFIKNWDTEIIKDYNKSLTKWDRMIYTTYVLPFLVEDGKDLWIDPKIPLNSVVLKKSLQDGIEFEGEYKQYEGDEYGEKINYFAGGFAFGLSKFFIEVPYDEKLYFLGEEPTLSARFNDKDTHLVSPPKNYIYHKYGREGRSLHWEDNKDWFLIDMSSKARVKSILNGEINDEYGIKDIDKLNEWKASALES